MTICPLAPAHLGDVAEIERQCFFSPWSEAALALLCTDAGFGAVATEDGRAVAYAGALAAADEGQITNVATLPAYRRRGYAAAVLDALFEAAAARGLSSLVLEVRESNIAARALYETFGFRTVGRRPHFYTHPAEAALILRADVGETKRTDKTI